MCYGIRIAHNNGIKSHGFAPRTGKMGSTAHKRPSQDAIKRKKGNRLRANNPKRALQLFRQEKKAEQEKRLQAAQEAIDERSKQKRNGG